MCIGGRIARCPCRRGCDLQGGVGARGARGAGGGGVAPAPKPPLAIAAISKGRWLGLSRWKGVASLLAAACAEALRVAMSKRARAQIAIARVRCVLLVNQSLRELSGRRKPPVNGG